MQLGSKLIYYLIFFATGIKTPIKCKKNFFFSRKRCENRVNNKKVVYLKRLFVEKKNTLKKLMI